MRNITHLVVHCSATDQSATVEAIQNYWKNNLGWRNPGYHVIITPDGVARELLSANGVANGVRGHNATSMHVCYIGGQFEDNRTDAQKAALLQQLTIWKQIWPHAIIQGHRDFPGVTKLCPNFDAKSEYAHL